ncbi:MAG: low specificity L-threonine aldolase [Candidatus Cloacimonadota bacterium]|nr:low specificity L-threonine aldolase [Candidatus Cloacimonadota bacterium]
MQKNKHSFASDNFSGVHPEVMKKLNEVNVGHTPAYGDDEYTTSAKEKLRRQFGEKIDIYFVMIGTGANALGIKAISKSYNSIICAESSHINVHECGAPQFFSGCPMHTISTNNGKITVKQIKNKLGVKGDPHMSQARVISLSQPTELGTLYTIDEIEKISNFAHKNNLLLHMDGVRLANAAASMRVSFKQMTGDVGVDVLSFGGTKNGLMCAESVIFFDKKLSEDFKYYRKQGSQLFSKMRYISAQFDAFFTNGLWLEMANNANKMSKKLATRMRKIPNIKIVQKVETNVVFAYIPPKIIPQLLEEYFFYVWDGEKSYVRLMTSFDTTENDIAEFVSFVKKKSQQ